MEGTGETDSLAEETGFKPWVHLADWCLSGPQRPNVIVRPRGSLRGHGWTQDEFGSVVAGGHPRDVFLIQRRPKPARYCRSGPFSFSLAKREGSGLDDTERSSAKLRQRRSLK
jgi:hypothetical protein